MTWFLNIWILLSAPLEGCRPGETHFKLSAFLQAKSFDFCLCSLVNSFHSRISVRIYFGTWRLYPRWSYEFACTHRLYSRIEKKWIPSSQVSDVLLYFNCWTMKRQLPSKPIYVPSIFNYNIVHLDSTAPTVQRRVSRHFKIMSLAPVETYLSTVNIQLRKRYRYSRSTTLLCRKVLR